MGQDRQGGEGRRPARKPATLDPGAQREGEERQPGETETGRETSPSKPGLHAPPEVSGEREREERPGQGQPPVTQHAREEHVGRDSRGEEDDRAQEAVHGLDGRSPEQHRPQGSSHERDPGGIELELRVPAPPVGIPVRGPGGRGQGAIERVPEPEELSRMVVEHRDAPPEGGVGERAAVEEEQEQRRLAPQGPHGGIVLSTFAGMAVLLGGAPIMLRPGRLVTR